MNRAQRMSIILGNLPMLLLFIPPFLMWLPLLCLYFTSIFVDGFGFSDGAAYTLALLISLVCMFTFCLANKSGARVLSVIGLILFYLPLCYFTWGMLGKIILEAMQDRSRNSDYSFDRVLVVAFAAHLGFVITLIFLQYLSLKRRIRKGLPPFDKTEKTQEEPTTIPQEQTMRENPVSYIFNLLLIALFIPVFRDLLGRILYGTNNLVKEMTTGGGSIIWYLITYLVLSVLFLIIFTKTRKMQTATIAVIGLLIFYLALLYIFLDRIPVYEVNESHNFLVQYTNPNYSPPLTPRIAFVITILLIQAHRYVRREKKKLRE